MRVRLTVLFMATGGAFAFGASTLGALALARESGIVVPVNFSLFPIHPYLQIFGFLAEFVMGVAYSIVPAFESKSLAKSKAARASYVLVTSGNLLILVAVLSRDTGSVFFESSALLILAASLAFSAVGMDLTAGARSNFGNEGECFIELSMISFVLISVVFLLNTVNFLAQLGFPKSGDPFSPGFLYLALLGFVGSMIYGVELKTVAFRNVRYRKTLAKTALRLQIAGVATAFATSLLGFTFLDTASSLLFLSSALLCVISINAMGHRKPLPPIGSMVGAEAGAGILVRNIILSYNRAGVLSSAIWLIAGCLIGVAWLTNGFLRSSYLLPPVSLIFRDSFIHSISIGFIGSTIIAYAPVLLPGVLSGKAPPTKLSLSPLLLLDSGITVRDAGNFFAAATGSPLPIWEAVSGLLVILAMALFVKMLRESANF